MVDDASIKQTPMFANLDPSVGWSVVAVRQGMYKVQTATRESLKSVLE